MARDMQRREVGMACHARHAIPLRPGHARRAAPRRTCAGCYGHPGVATSARYHPDVPRPAGVASARATRKPMSRAARYPRNVAPPVLAEARRGAIVESRHRGHVVQVSVTGEVERAIGDPDISVT